MQKQRKKGFLNRIAQWAIRVYQFLLSPDESVFFRSRLRGKICRHQPHCSAYAYDAYQRYSFFQASYRILDRVSRCTPGNSVSYDPVVYRVVFASGSPLGVPFLEELIKDPRFEVVGILTMPDKASGRGMKIQQNSIAQRAQELGVARESIRKSHSLRLESKKFANEAHETAERLEGLKPDFLYTIAYGHILPQHILDIPRIAAINIHGSLLPEYRGASPLQQVFLDERSETGITLMRMEAGLDSGPMIDKQFFKLAFTDTVVELIERIKLYTPKWSLNALDEYAHGELEEEAQDDAKASFCGKIEKEDGFIVLSLDSLESIYAKYRAFALRPKLWFIRGEKRFIVDALVVDEVKYEIYKKELLVDGNQLNPAIKDLSLKPEGKKSISWEEFIDRYLL